MYGDPNRRRRPDPLPCPGYSVNRRNDLADASLRSMATIAPQLGGFGSVLYTASSEPLQARQDLCHTGTTACNHSDEEVAIPCSGLGTQTHAHGCGTRTVLRGLFEGDRPRLSIRGELEEDSLQLGLLRDQVGHQCSKNSTPRVYVLSEIAHGAEKNSSGIQRPRGLEIRPRLLWVLGLISSAMYRSNQPSFGSLGVGAKPPKTGGAKQPLSVLRFEVYRRSQASDASLQCSVRSLRDCGW